MTTPAASALTNSITSLQVAGAVAKTADEVSPQKAVTVHKDEKGQV